MLVAGLLALAGCSPSPEGYAGLQPAMDIREYFNGEVEATGVFIDWKGKADPHFHVAMKGTWNGNEGTLEEKFAYSDGRSDQRVWSLHMIDDHHFTGTAHDVIGTAQGQQFGNAVNMRYVLRVPVKDSTYDLSMDDWLYRLDAQNLVNRVEMRKFGFKVGELVISFHKKEPHAAGQ